VSSGLIKGIAGGLVVAAILFAIYQAIDDSETVEFGEGEVTFDPPDDATDVEVLREAIIQFEEQAGTTDEVRSCIEQELGKVPDSELAGYVDVLRTSSPEAAREEILPLTLRLQRECVRARQPVVEEDLDANQIALIREASEQQLETMFARAQVPERVTQCVIDRYRQLSDAEIIEVANESLQDSRRRWFRYGRECG
jgi:hypothetical protein